MSTKFLTSIVSLFMASASYAQITSNSDFESIPLGSELAVKFDVTFMEAGKPPFYPKLPSTYLELVFKDLGMKPNAYELPRTCLFALDTPVAGQMRLPTGLKLKIKDIKSQVKDVGWLATSYARVYSIKLASTSEKYQMTLTCELERQDREHVAGLYELRVGALMNYFDVFLAAPTDIE